MSASMTTKQLAEVRELLAESREHDSPLDSLVVSMLADLLADRDYHANRADEAEAEAAQALADCAAYKRERDTHRLALAAARGELVR
jgi:hypothetical protein